MAENIQLNIEEKTEDNEMSLDNFIVNNDDFVNRRNRRLGITSNTQRQVDIVWERDGERLLNKAIKDGYINATTIPFQIARRHALKLWKEGIAWPTVGDIEHQERHQDWIRRKCEMLFNTKSMPDRYAFAILMLLGPTHLRSQELNCWEDCYDFLDFDDEEGMFKMVIAELEPGQTINCACSHHIKNLYEVTCKDVKYNKNGSIGNIDMRALHLGSDCIYKRSIVPKIKDEVDKHGTSNPSPMLKRMIYEVAKREKKRCAMCNELNVGYTSKFDKCRDCRKELKRLEEQSKREAKEKEDNIKCARRKYSEKVSDSWKARNGKYKGQYWSDIIIKDPDYVKWYQQDFKYGFGALTVGDLLRYDTNNYWSGKDEEALDSKIWYNIMFHMYVQDKEHVDPDSEQYERINNLILKNL